MDPLEARSCITLEPTNRAEAMFPGAVTFSWNLEKFNLLFSLFTTSHLSLLFEWILLWNRINFPFRRSEFEAGDKWNFLSNSLKTIRLVDESDLWGRSHAYPFSLKETDTRAYKTASGAVWTRPFHSIFRGRTSILSTQFEADRMSNGGKRQLNIGWGLENFL